MSENENIQNKILDWLSKEGYPLEFRVANIFRKFKFNTSQGNYVNDFKTNNPREIDVIAQHTTRVENSFLRISYLVECKWTGNKPWVIFTDEKSRIAPSACIAQCITSNVAVSILWLLANDKDVQKLSIFQTPQRPGFNGRQAFGSQNDLVFSTLQSIISASYSEKKFYESFVKSTEDVFSNAVLIIPIVVIDGKLYETFYNDKKEKIEIKERNQIRLHWRGSEAWHLHSTLDIITIDSLPDYVSKLSVETKVLLEKMVSTFFLVKKCLNEKTIEPIKSLIGGARGALGLPPILNKIIEFNKNGT
ncbi:MAG: hypothetical protein MUO34_00650 [Ignavibacteriaceae bacterium]|nr:hypothetical protein [Ignavibacteriaceae bacterium]